MHKSILKLNNCGFPIVDLLEKFGVFRVDFNCLDTSVMVDIFSGNTRSVWKEFYMYSDPYSKLEEECIKNDLEFAFFISRLGGSDVYVEDKEEVFAFRQFPIGLGWFAVAEPFLKARIVNALRSAGEQVLLDWPEIDLSREERNKLSKQLGLPIC